MGPIHSPIGDRNRLWTLRSKVGCGQFDHFAGAHNQEMGLADIFEQALGQTNRGSGERDGMGAKLRLGPNLFGDREGALKELMQVGAQRLGFLGAAGRVLHLSKNLRFTQHHRVQSAGDAKCMPNCALTWQGVQMFRQLATGYPTVIGDPFLNGGPGLLRRFGRSVDFGPVAGREDGALGHQFWMLAAQVSQRVAQKVRWERDPFAQCDRSGHVIQSEG